MEAVAKDFAAKGVLVDAKLTGCGHALPLIAFQGFPDGALFDLFQGPTPGRLKPGTHLLEVFREVFGTNPCVSA